MSRWKVTRPAIVRMWARVERSGECWVWTGARMKTGHGQIGADAPSHRTVLTHRLSWESAYGPIPEGLQVNHTCDNPPCVRPSHLYLGDKSQNALDAVRRHGMNQGVRSRIAKLNADDVRRIRVQLADGRAKKDIALEFGVTISPIYAIEAGTTWSHVVDEPVSRA